MLPQKAPSPGVEALLGPRWGVTAWVPEQVLLLEELALSIQETGETPSSGSACLNC